jgi:hypothetical protein
MTGWWILPMTALLAMAKRVTMRTDPCWMPFSCVHREGRTLSSCTRSCLINMNVHKQIGTCSWNYNWWRVWRIPYSHTHTHATTWMCMHPHAPPPQTHTHTYKTHYTPWKVLRRRQSIAPLYLNLGTRRGVSGQHHAPAALYQWGRNPWYPS